MGGGRAVPVEGGYRVRVAGPSALVARRAPGCSAASRFSTAPNRAAGPGWQLGLLARDLRAFRSADRRGELGGVRDACDRQLRLDGRRCLPAGAADDGPRGRPARQSVEALARSVVRVARASVGRAPPQRRDHRHRPGWYRRTDRAGRREDAAWADLAALREPHRSRTPSGAPTRF